MAKRSKEDRHSNKENNNMSKNVDYRKFKFIEKVGKYNDYANCLL